jgi:hypothetical protein
MNWRQKSPALAVFASRQQMSGEHFFRQTVCGDFYHRDEVESQEEEIHEIFVAYILTREMGVNEAQAPQPAAGRPDTAKRRDHDL